MISVPAGARILLATQPVDFRRGAHGLAALAQEVLGEDPFSGVVIVWRCKRGDRVKILLWDTSGLVLIWKQLQQGSFRWPPIMNGVKTQAITRSPAHPTPTVPIGLAVHGRALRTLRSQFERTGALAARPVDPRGWSGGPQILVSNRLLMERAPSPACSSG